MELELINWIKPMKNEHDIIALLKEHGIFPFVRDFLMDTQDIDYTNGQFIDEQNILSFAHIKQAVIDALYVAAKK